MAAQRELLERNDNESKAHGSDLGSQSLHWALNMCFYPLNCAIIALQLRFIGLFALILRPRCAAEPTERCQD